MVTINNNTYANINTYATYAVVVRTFFVASYISTIKCFTRLADILGNPEHMAPTRRLNDVSPSDAKEKGSMCSTTIITNACSSTLTTKSRDKARDTHGGNKREGVFYS